MDEPSLAQPKAMPCTNPRRMSRFPTLTTALAAAVLVIVSLQPAAFAKNKSAAAIPKKKTPSAEVADSNPPAADGKKGSGAPLDLPLPAKVPAPGETSAQTGKTGLESGASSVKSPEKSGADAPVKREHAPNATIEPDSIVEFAAQPPRIQQLIRDAIDLTRLKLTYKSGSADPDDGGMDSPGSIYYLLHARGLNDVARDASGQYLWARKSGTFFPVVSKSAESVEFNELLPGDLMFWTGPDEPGHDVPISHVMLYLGREKETGKRIMFGASDGRSYNGIPRRGVSIFDFNMPKADQSTPEKATADFVGFARVPGLRTAMMPAADSASAAPPPREGAKAPTKSATTSAKKKKGKARKSDSQ